MKKALLFLTALLLVPGYLHAQISIGDQEFDSLPAALGEAEDGDVIEISGAIVLEEQVGFSEDHGRITIRGTSEDASIEMDSEDSRLIVEENGRATWEDIEIVGVQNSGLRGGVSAVLPHSELVMYNVTIHSSESSNHGGVFLLEPQASVEAYNSVFRDNKAGLNGAVFFAHSDGTSMHLEDCLFLNNEASTEEGTHKGAALSWINLGQDEQGEMLAINTAFIGNHAGHGGAYAPESTNMTFVNSTFSGNTADGAGGAIWQFNTQGEEFTTTLINTTVSDNTVGGEGSGGGLFTNHATAFFDLQNSVVAENLFDDGEGDTGVSNINAYGENVESMEIPALNSFFPELPGNMELDASSADNLHDGDLYLGDVNVDEEVYWHPITDESSDLVTLGDPNLLISHSQTDQRGAERDFEADAISAGAYDYNAELVSSTVKPDLANSTTLKQNYPNPFNPTTSIEFVLPEHVHVELDVYNMLGEHITSLASGSYNQGTHAVSFDANNLSSGVYIYRLQAGEQTVTKQMMLVK